jgi:hypothetical protein
MFWVAAKAIRNPLQLLDITELSFSRERVRERERDMLVQAMHCLRHTGVKWRALERVAEMTKNCCLLEVVSILICLFIAVVDAISSHELHNSST